MQEAAIAGKPPDNRPICVRPEAWSESAGADLGHASDVRPEQVVNCLRGVRSQWWRVGWWWGGGGVVKGTGADLQTVAPRRGPNRLQPIRATPRTRPRVWWWWRLLSLLLLCCKARVEKKLLSR